MTPQRTKVLWLVKGLGPGGAERLLVSLAGSIDHDEFEAAGVAVECLWGGRQWDLRWVARFARLIRTWRPNVVHFHSPLPAALGRLVVRMLVRRRWIGLVSTEHNLWPSFNVATRVANGLTLPLDDVHLAVAAETRDSVWRRYRERVDVLVHGVPLESVRTHLVDRERVREELGVSDSEVLCVTLANLREKKDYPNLLNAARLVLDAGAGVRFAAAGQGPLEDEIRALHERLGLGDGLRLLGYREDSLDLLAAADLFVMSSLHEGYPVSLMEALALGRAVVATAVGGIPDAVRPGVEGVLVPPADSDALAAAIIRLACDGSLRQEMSAAAADRGERYDIGVAARRHEEIYRSLARLRVSPADVDPYTRRD
jgi:glycosyltransferase involved in cell wall biosynthesis